MENFSYFEGLKRYKYFIKHRRFYDVIKADPLP